MYNRILSFREGSAGAFKILESLPVVGSVAAVILSTFDSMGSLSALKYVTRCSQCRLMTDI